MRRRDFIAALGGAAAIPWADRGFTQSATKVVGVQLGTSSQDTEQINLVELFVSELAKLGWAEGRNVRFVYRWGDGNLQLVQQHAHELAALSPDVVLAQGTPVTLALKNVTQSVPVVFVNVADPTMSGIVQSLSRPTGNITGFTNYEPAMGGKWLELLREIAPDVRRVLLIFNPDNTNNARLADGIAELARPLGVRTVHAPARTTSEIEGYIDGFRPDGESGFIVIPDFITTAHRALIIERAQRYTCPAVYPFRMFAASGGLAAYALDQSEAFRNAANYADRILRGAAPRDLPVQTPVKYKLVINAKTAKALGLELSPTLLARADEVIE